jgi:vacuolar-type H+-ATPase subunit H
MEETHAATPVFSADALKHLKEVEAEWDHRLTETKAQLAVRLAKAREAAEKAVQSARTEADRLRDARLTEVRATAQAEAEQLIAEGKRTASTVASGTLKGVQSAKARILDAVLGEFAPSSDPGGK